MTAPRVSVVIPTRDAADTIDALVAAVRAQAAALRSEKDVPLARDAVAAERHAAAHGRPGPAHGPPAGGGGLPAAGGLLEVLVVDDASGDGTAEVAERAGARVIRLPPRPDGGNPAAARNRGAEAARGEVLVFLDADCVPAPGWLGAHLTAHERGERIVGGALDLPPGLSPSARCDYYCGWYNVHSRRPAGPVPNHPPGNLSVRRDLFLATRRFDERQPIAFAHEELGWQAELGRRGVRIWFEPQAVVHHRNRPGFGNLLRRSYRWGYSSVESKSRTGAARFAGLYRIPLVPIVAAPALALAHTGYILAQWIRAGRLEPILMTPAVLAARAAYAAGSVSGGLRWLARPSAPPGGHRPRWE